MRGCYPPCSESSDLYPVAIYGFETKSGLDKLECAGSYGKRPKKSSDWQISIDRTVPSCIEPCRAEKHNMALFYTCVVVKILFKL